MPLTNFEVAPQANVDDSISIKADDGSIRVVANISKDIIDDYFNNIQKQPADLIKEHLPRISEIMNDKYKQGLARIETRHGSEIRVIDINTLE